MALVHVNGGQRHWKRQMEREERNECRKQSEPVFLCSHTECGAHWAAACFPIYLPSHLFLIHQCSLKGFISRKGWWGKLGKAEVWKMEAERRRRSHLMNTFAVDVTCSLLPLRATCVLFLVHFHPFLFVLLVYIQYSICSFPPLLSPSSNFSPLHIDGRGTRGKPLRNGIAVTSSLTQAPSESNLTSLYLPSFFSLNCWISLLWILSRLRPAELEIVLFIDVFFWKATYIYRRENFCL